MSGMLNADSDTSGTEEVVNACKARGHAMHVVKARRRIGTREDLPAMSPFQAFPPHIVHLLSNSSNDCSLF